MRGDRGSRPHPIALGIVCFLMGIMASWQWNMPPPRPATQLSSVPVFVKQDQSQSQPQSQPRMEERNGEYAYARRLCQNNIRDVYGESSLTKAVTERFAFHQTALKILTEYNSKPPITCEKACAEFSCHPNLKVCEVQAKNFSGQPYGWKRYDLMGPVAQCPSMVSYGLGDEEKRFCLDRQPFEKSLDCVVFSLGSNNQWGFEEDVIRNTKCRIHTFDCTVDGHNMPSAIKDRVTFHKLCLGPPEKSKGDMKYLTFQQMLTIASVQHVTLLKMDIEGFEFEALQEMLTSVEMPAQIAIEFHYATPFKAYFHGRDLSPAELYAFFNDMFARGGYLVADRRKNDGCPHCEEVLLVRALC